MKVALYLLAFSAGMLIIVASTAYALIHKQPNPDKAMRVANTFFKQLMDPIAIAIIAFITSELIAIAWLPWTSSDFATLTVTNLYIALIIIAFGVARIKLHYDPDAPPS